MLEPMTEELWFQLRPVRARRDLGRKVRAGTLAYALEKRAVLVPDRVDPSQVERYFTEPMFFDGDWVDVENVMTPSRLGLPEPIVIIDAA